MKGINGLIYYVHENGWGKTVYDFGFLSMIIASTVFFIVHSKKYGVTCRKAITLSSIAILITCTLSVILAWVASGFKIFGPSELLRTFIFVPLIGMICSKIMKIPTGIVLDLLAPGILVWHISGHCLCPFLGCCAGIACKWGIWNPVMDQYVFPIQWITCLFALFVLLWILGYQRRNGYDGKGKSYAIMLILYGAARFFLEFLKHGNKLFFGISILALYAIIMFLLGFTWLFTAQEIELKRQEDAKGV